MKVQDGRRLKAKHTGPLVSAALPQAGTLEGTLNLRNLLKISNMQALCQQSCKIPINSLSKQTYWTESGIISFSSRRGCPIRVLTFCMHS